MPTRVPMQMSTQMPTRVPTQMPTPVPSTAKSITSAPAALSELTPIQNNLSTLNTQMAQIIAQQTQLANTFNSSLT